MKKKQLEMANAIVSLSKAFADQMRENMVRSGLLDENYRLDISVQPLLKVSPDSFVKNTVYLRNGEDGYTIFKYVEKGWEVLEEPKNDDAGAVQSSIRNVQPDKGYPGTGKAVEKATPPDGLWLSVHDESNPDADMVV